jgi:pimeloyl-ACP methyl ester carboxylesterase
VIALDRPGYGASTYVPGRTFLDWSQDLAGAADRLGVEEYAVLGASGSSPFALACGYELGERVKSIGIVLGSAPLSAPGMADAPIISGAARFRPVRRMQYALSALALPQHGHFTWITSYEMTEVIRTVGLG